ncbi:hypothetical protein D1872_37250 [compost metagenome]
MNTEPNSVKTTFDDVRSILTNENVKSIVFDLSHMIFTSHVKEVQQFISNARTSKCLYIKINDNVAGKFPNFVVSILSNGSTKFIDDTIIEFTSENVDILNQFQVIYENTHKSKVISMTYNIYFK